MEARQDVPSLSAFLRSRVFLPSIVALLGLTVGGCQDRGDLLGVELVVFTVGQWYGVGAQGEELRFLLERDGDDAVLTAFVIELPQFADMVQGQADACAALVGAFSTFGNIEVRVPVRNAGFSFRTPNDFRVDNDGLIELTVNGRFEAQDSAVVDADVLIDPTQFLPCRSEFSVSWDMSPIGS